MGDRYVSNVGVPKALSMMMTAIGGSLALAVFLSGVEYISSMAHELSGYVVVLYGLRP